MVDWRMCFVKCAMCVYFETLYQRLNCLYNTDMHTHTHARTHARTEREGYGLNDVEQCQRNIFTYTPTHHPETSICVVQLVTCYATDQQALGSNPSFNRAFGLFHRSMKHFP